MFAVVFAIAEDVFPLNLTLGLSEFSLWTALRTQCSESVNFYSRLRRNKSQHISLPHHMWGMYRLYR